MSKNRSTLKRSSISHTIPITLTAAFNRELLLARALSQRIESGRKRKKPKDKYLDNWGNVLRGYGRTMRLGVFADSGRTPKITDVEVAVCFADLRGFTKYVHALQKDGQDNRVQLFLKSYFRIYPQSVLNIMWNLEPDGKEISAVDEELLRLIVPTSYKNLGDGMMLVWELQGASNERLMGLASRMIYSVIEEIKDQFEELSKVVGAVEIDSFSKHARELRIGFGLSRGHAWRLDFGHHLPVDYAGSIVNLAARLQGLARPSGIVAQLGFSESLFHDMQKASHGRITKIPAPKGLGKDEIDIWTSSGVRIP
jgi:class 3 adenylate cyclase